MNLNDTEILNKLKDTLSDDDFIVPSVPDESITDENPDWAGATEEHKQWLRSQSAAPREDVPAVITSPESIGKSEEGCIINYINSEVDNLKRSLGINKLAVNNLNACAIEPVVDKL